MTGNRLLTHASANPKFTARSANPAGGEVATFIEDTYPGMRVWSLLTDYRDAASVSSATEATLGPTTTYTAELFDEGVLAREVAIEAADEVARAEFGEEVAVEGAEQIDPESGVASYLIQVLLPRTLIPSGSPEDFAAVAERFGRVTLEFRRKLSPAHQPDVILLPCFADADRPG